MLVLLVVRSLDLQVPRSISSVHIVDGVTHPSAAPPDLEATTVLLSRIREGDEAARDILARRYLPVLRRWAHGRLPHYARGLAETQDLVQVSLLKALNHADGFVPVREGAFLAYLRQILVNEIRMEIRKSSRRPEGGALTEDLAANARSPLAVAIDEDVLDGYERALERLSDDEKQGVILRLELGFTHQQVADALGKPSADAARMLVARATMRLTEIMDDHR